MNSFGILNPKINENTFKQLLAIVFSGIAAKGALDNRIQEEKNQRIIAEKKIIELGDNFDKRYTNTKKWMANPFDKSIKPVIKKSQVDNLNKINSIILKHEERINSYNGRVLKLKNQALLKSLR